MTFQIALANLYSTYGKYGVSNEFISEQLRNGILEYGFSVDAAYNSLRIVLAIETGEHELFTIEDVMEITGESREELTDQIEQYREELVAAGENPDDYFIPVKPEKISTFFFSHGIPLQ